MDIVLNRRGGVPVRDQLVTQLEMKILGGQLAPGQRLPSVRSLARRLKVHPNTVSAAYQDLKASGRVMLRKGAGVFVQSGGPRHFTDAKGLDEMIRLALQAALRQGFSATEIRSAAERWLAAVPPDSIVVVDPVPAMAEILMQEVREALGVRVSCCTLDELAQNPSILSGALGLTLPYHVERLGQIAPGAAFEVANLEMSDELRQMIQAIPGGAVVVVISHSPTVLPFASVLLRSLRGDELLVEGALVSQPRAWRRLCRAADVVFVDALAVHAVRRAQPRKLREFRIVSEEALERLRSALTFVVPRQTSRDHGARA